MKTMFFMSFWITAVSSIALPQSGGADTQATSTQIQTIDQALTRLNQYAQIQRQLQIQDADMAYATRKSLVIADLLFDSQGIPDFSLCPAVQATFLPRQTEDYEVNMAKVLNLINPSWAAIFNNMNAPANEGFQSLALRSLFSLGMDQPITSRHVRVAVLGSMLAPYFQGSVGDCFAVSDMIRDHEEFYLSAAKDYASLATKGYIERSVDGQENYFFFLPKLEDDDLGRSLSISSSGMINGTACSLLDAPGFHAACTLMGGNSLSNLLQTTLQILFSNISGDVLQTTPANIINAMAQAIASNSSGTNANDLAATGDYAFSSLNQNPILRGIEAAFSAMAEDRPGDSVRSDINQSIQAALQNYWPQFANTAGIDAFKNSLFTSLDDSFRLVYNLNIPLAQVSADGNSTAGGFQLYSTIANGPAQMGTPVTTPQELGQFMRDVIRKVLAASGSTPDTQSIANVLTQAVETNDFLQNVLWAYDPDNKKIADPVANYLQLPYTPMQTCVGDDPVAVYDIDAGSKDDKIVKYTPDNTQQLITWCLNLAKSVPAQMILMESPQHAFNFMPGNPDIVSFIKSKKSTAQWLNQVLIAPGLAISRQIIPQSSQQQVAQGMNQFISSALTNPGAFQNLVNTLGKTSLSVHDYAQKLLSGINRILQLNQDQQNAVALQLDQLLLASLPDKSLSVLQGSAVRFALTNWNEGTKDIYFCAFFNPRTQCISFGTILEDKTQITPMDESQWVNHCSWNVDLNSVTAPAAAR